MESLPNYDLWLTTPPDPEIINVYCPECGEEFDGEIFACNDVCESCEEGTLIDVEPSEPCRCKNHCYC